MACAEHIIDRRFQAQRSLDEAPLRVLDITLRVARERRSPRAPHVGLPLAQFHGVPRASPGAAPSSTRAAPGTGGPP